MDVSAKINAAVRLVLPVIQRLVVALKNAHLVEKVTAAPYTVVKIPLARTVK